MEKLHEASGVAHAEPDAGADLGGVYSDSRTERFRVGRGFESNARRPGAGGFHGTIVGVYMMFDELEIVNVPAGFSVLKFV